jgi:hypothetical protein
MRDDDYQRTAKALARETRMSDARASRIEDELLTAMSSASAARVFGPRRYSDERKWLAAAAVVVLAAGSMVLWKLSGPPEQAAHPKQVVSDTPSVPDVRPEQSPKTTVVTSAKRPQPARTKRAIQTTLIPRVVSPHGFVELPWTAGLPAFESGEIVRVEVPVASLPAYGFDISRGMNRSVEADVLVGQDGLARAMRIVSNSTRSTQ